jgi:hypothetical protein
MFMFIYPMRWLKIPKQRENGKNFNYKLAPVCILSGLNLNLIILVYSRQFDIFT